MTPQTIHLGFEVGSGEPVAIPLRHLAVTGQTQESGKTTTLEALVDRAGVPAIAFVTKRGEGSFAGGRRLQPYFRERADWQFVDQLLEAQLREKNKFLRPWLMKICRNTKTLAEVHAAIKSSLKKAKGFNEGIYTQLDAYLDLIVPEIGRARLATSIELKPGLNVMDVSGFPAPMQMLFVQSAIDWVNERERGVVTIVPEAWEFIPEGKGSPVKASAVALVRKGAGLGNFIWVDSQDMAGVAKEILRGCTVWVIGVQREANEIKRNLANIPASIARPKAGDIARLERGQFYACWGERTIKTYVRPAWMSEEHAIGIATGAWSIEEVRAPVKQSGGFAGSSSAGEQGNADAGRSGGFAGSSSAGEQGHEQDHPFQSADQREESMGSSTDEKLDRLTGLLERFVEGGIAGQRAVDRASSAAAGDGAEIDAPALTSLVGETAAGELIKNASSKRREPNKVATQMLVDGEPVFSVFSSAEEEQLYQRFKGRLASEAPALLKVLTIRPEIEVEVEVRVITYDGTSMQGRVARLLHEGFFDSGKKPGELRSEMCRTGSDPGPSAAKYLPELVSMGFLVRQDGGRYQAVEGMKVNVVKKG